nr:unnamed protein product [Spirometra erinaceieuropaei]
MFTKFELDALGELKAGKDMLAMPADKERSKVELDSTDYLQKAKVLLEYRQTWRSRQSSCFYKANTMKWKIVFDTPKCFSA